MVKKFTIKKTSAGIRALPVNFKGKFLGFAFSILNQFDIYGKVASEFYATAEDRFLFSLNGNADSVKIGIENLYGKVLGATKQLMDDRDRNNLKKDISKFLKQVNSEVKNYNEKNISEKKVIHKTVTPKKNNEMAHRKKTERKKVHTIKGKVKAYKRKSIVKAHTRRVAGITGTPKFYDEHAAREIEIFAENDGDLYRQQRRPILINLSKKYKKGVYDISKAAKLWRYFIDSAMKKYNKEFGSRGDKWSDLLKTSDRQILAEKWAQETKDEFDLNNFTEQ